jgi:hypothetical protein
MSVSATFLFDSVFWLYGDMANVNFFLFSRFWCGVSVFCCVRFESLVREDLRVSSVGYTRRIKINNLNSEFDSHVKVNLRTFTEIPRYQDTKTESTHATKGLRRSIVSRDWCTHSLVIQ